MFSSIASGGRWMLPPHLYFIAKKLQDVLDGKCKRLMIFMPPRHGKSELVSRYFPACAIRQKPECRVILTSYEASFAEHWGEQARDAWMTAGALTASSTALVKNRGNWWSTPEGGYMTTAGVGGPITGKGMDIGIIDDPVKNAEEAYSETRREAIWNWYQSTFLTRLEPHGAVVLMMTRWHDDDLAGRLLKKEGADWDVVRLPAIAEDGDPIGREVGAPLWPQRFGLDELKPYMAMSPRWWASLYQQRPLVGEGSIAKREWFPIIEAMPEGAKAQARAWDLAATAKKGADFLCGCKVVRAGGLFIIADMSRSQFDPSGVLQRIQTIAAQDGRGVHVGIEQEPGASGKMTVAHIGQLLAGHRVQALHPGGDKVFRAMPMLDQAKMGNIKLLRGAWNDAFLQEIDAFGTGSGHDDQGDTAAYGFNMVASPAYVGFSLPS